MSNHSELKDLRSEGIHFTNIYKFMILKCTMMPQINEALVGSQPKYKSALQYPFGFCCHVSFIRIIFSRNCHHLFVSSLLISDLFVFLLLLLLLSVYPDISKIFFRFINVNNCSQKYVLTNIKHIWKTN